MRALIRLAVLYRESLSLSGPLFLKVNKNGAVMQDTPLVSPVVLNTCFFK
jgi:hypothetical protein